MSGIAFFPHAVGQQAPAVMYATVSENRPLPASYADPLAIVEPHRPNQYREIATWVASALPSHGAPVMVVRDNYGNETAIVGAQHAAPGNATEINGTPVPLTGSAWITPTLINSWVNFGSAFETAGYLRDPLGFVRLKGTVKSGTLGAAAFVLPAGYRPGAKAYYVGGNNSVAEIQIDASGNVVIFDANNAIGLSGITFLAEN